MPAGNTNFPTSLDSHSGGSPKGFAQQTNLLSTQLSSGIDNAVVSIPVVSTTGFPSVGAVVIDSEVIFYGSIDATHFLTAVRASDGTTAASHSNGASVSQVPIAANHNDVAAAIVATETKMGTGASTPTSGTVMGGTGTGTSSWRQIVQGDIDYSSLGSVLRSNNYIIDGDAEADSRGSINPVPNNTYFADRWFSCQQTANCFRYLWSTGWAETGLDLNVYFLLRALSANQKYGMAQGIENSLTKQLLGRTISCRALVACSNTAINPIKMALLKWTSTADTLTKPIVSSWNAAGTPPTWAGSYTQLGIATASPAINTMTELKIEGISVPTDSNNLVLVIWSDSTTMSIGHDLDITNVSIEQGAKVSGAFPRRLQALEYAICQRYHQRWWRSASGLVLPMACTTTTAAVAAIKLPYPMRTSPTLVLSPALANFQLVLPATTVALSTLTLSNQNPWNFDGGKLDATVASGLTAGQAIHLGVTSAANSYLAFDAEI